MLQKLGYQYLSADAAMKLCGGKSTQVILEDVLRRKVKEINSLRIGSRREERFSNANIVSGIRALKALPMNEGYINDCESACNLVALSKTLEQMRLKKNKFC